VKRNGKRSEQSHSERWQISYAGLMTLLFALFVILYAQSKVDVDRLKKVQQGSQTANSSESSNATLTQARSAIQESIRLETGVTDVGDKVEVSEDDRGLIVRLAARDFFDDGVVEARAELRPLLDRIAKVLSGISNSIRVEGHIDIEEETSEGSKGWTLSTERAAWVIKYWIKRWDMDPERFSAAGLSHYHPLTQKKDDYSRGRNRRVEIIILRKPVAEPSAESITR
jgi:chemotaxis protein MotB